MTDERERGDFVQRIITERRDHTLVGLPAVAAEALTLAPHLAACVSAKLKPTPSAPDSEAVTQAVAAIFLSDAALDKPDRTVEESDEFIEAVAMAVISVLEGVFGEESARAVLTTMLMRRVMSTMAEQAVARRAAKEN